MIHRRPDQDPIAESYRRRLLDTASSIGVTLPDAAYKANALKIASALIIARSLDRIVDRALGKET